MTTKQTDVYTNTPYCNTIQKKDEPDYPGNLELEARIRSLVRWNALAMVVRANRHSTGIGGHISTYASAATLYEVAFNHFFRGKDDLCGGDVIYFQGHASPGIYARAFLEGRFNQKQLENFRRESKPEGGLSSYPHPQLMPDFWEFPSVSMGLAPIMAIYQARFNQYLHDRGLVDTPPKRVWAFLGDGETDEPEALGALSVASRENLNNLIFVVNCNLQRLDGPVRGNGKIIQELESVFLGAGWNVIKVIWGHEWDDLLARDQNGLLQRRMQETCDGQYQKYSVSSGDYIREHFFGKDPELTKMVQDYSDTQLRKLRRGGHDPQKVYAAYDRAIKSKDRPTVILAKTVKGYGLGEAGEGRNITHQQKKLNEDELRDFRARFSIPVSDEDIHYAPFFKPGNDSEEIQYLIKRRRSLGGFVPVRSVKTSPLKLPPADFYEEFYEGSNDRPVSTTMAFVSLLHKLLQDSDIGRQIVPIVPDEARTFGMDSLFRKFGIYSHKGQLYEPVDAQNLLYYKESTDGQILEEGITEAGSLSSFIAAGSSYATQGLPMIPFYVFYSMFGLQRVGDLVWAAADTRCRGFLIGGTSGRTTLAGEGLQHQDGNSHVLALTVPNLLAYDPAFAFETAVIIEDGLKHMYERQEDVFYYITVGNENYVMPSISKEDINKIKDGILKGMYCYKRSSHDSKAKAQLLASGAIINEALKAAETLEKEYDVAANVWSVTSYKALYTEVCAMETENFLNPTDKTEKPYITRLLQDESGVVVAVSDYIKALPNSVARWIPLPVVTLGTDGFGFSEARSELRDFFKIDAKHIVLSALTQLFQNDMIAQDAVEKAQNDMKIIADKKG